LQRFLRAIAKSNFRNGGDALPGVEANQQVCPTLSEITSWPSNISASSPRRLRSWKFRLPNLTLYCKVDGMDTNVAAENLQVIRTLMERSALYRRALAPVMTFAGGLGIIAAITGVALRADTSAVFVAYWMTVALLGQPVALAATRMARRSSRLAAAGCGFIAGNLDVYRPEGRRFVYRCRGIDVVAGHVGYLLRMRSARGWLFYIARAEIARVDLFGGGPCRVGMGIDVPSENRLFYGHGEKFFLGM
jgi:hypothetical protein